MLYFAYGSNMDRAQMQERCRSARFVCTAKLEGHRLVFPRKSSHRKCGAASVERSDGSDVWGVVYQIDELDIATLDEREGYDVNLPADQNSYLRKKTRVLRDGYEEQAIAVWTYEANPKPTPPTTERRIQRTHRGGCQILATAARLHRRTREDRDQRVIAKECKQLAEVDFPIAVASRHAAREKAIRHGRPSTLHIWWARRQEPPKPPLRARGLLGGLAEASPR